MRILVVEDDNFIAKALTEVLSSQNYTVEVASDGQAGWELIQVFAYDLIMLDVMLPKLDGISLCKLLRESGYQTPVLLLTGRNTGHDKAIGLDAGADDYLVKPFDLEELFARVRALLRRSTSTSPPILEWENLRLNPSSCEVFYGTHPVNLTPKEYALLELFLRNSGRVFSCSAILDRIWAFDKTPGDEAVRTQIKGLRHKLKSVGAPADYIETVYGIGYRLKPAQAKIETNGEVTLQQTRSAIAGVWQRFKGKISDQVAVIEATATKLRQGNPDIELQAKAEREAHTLAGSLGTFGFKAGSQIAREIEGILQSQEKDIARLDELVAALRQEIERSPNAALEIPATSPKPKQQPLLLVVDSDRQLATQLAGAAGMANIRAEIATNLAEAQTAIAQQPPDLLLLDIDIGTNQDSLALLASASNRTPALPVLVCTAQASLKSRLEVARLGGRAFLQKPVPTDRVIAAVTQILQQTNQNGTEAKVMVVDDDPQILATVKELLEPWGIIVITLDDPQRFWETLSAFTPDLLILDIKMPQLSGIELCQIVKNDPQWSKLPIIFLTAQADKSAINQVLAVGGDDFVSKPIVGAELVIRIVNRLEQVKQQRN